MKYRILFILFLGLVPLTAIAQSNLTVKEISFVFEYKDVSGTIADFRSSSKVNMQDLSTSYFEGSVGVSSLKTGNFLRDWALKGGKYFDEDEYPRIYFRSSEVIKSDQGINVKGELTMKGRTNPLIFQFTQTAKGLRGIAELYTSDYGINIKKKREENKVSISLEFEIE